VNDVEHLTDEEVHITSEQLAARWKRRVPWVHEAARAGEIPGAWKAGRFWRFHLPTIEQHEDASRSESIFALTDASRARQKP
jgi:hypothetical protein